MEGIKFVTYDFLKGKADTLICVHGADMVLGRNLVAVVGGRLCPISADCEWCDSVWRRIQSRTGGRPA